MVVRKSREEWKIRHGVFDQFTLRVLEKLRGQQHFDELRSPLALGKEANIFTTTGNDTPIVKIYRLENRDFTGMLEYLTADPRYMHVKRRKREIVFAWTQREYRNLMIARETIPVPKPIAVLHNVLVMSQIGTPVPAPQVKDRVPQEPQVFWERVMTYMCLLRDAGMVHGDLSEYNILNDRDQPVFIDFSQSSPMGTPMADALWERDVRNVTNAARKQGATLDASSFA